MRNPTKRGPVIAHVVLIGLMAAIGACSDAGGPTAESQLAIAGPRLAVAAIAIAAGSEGHSFLDNSLSCPRRGIVDYVNVAGGREVSFTGCDLGEGVVITGHGELRWPGAGGAQREPFCTGTPEHCATTLNWIGSLSMAVGSETVAVTEFSISAIGLGAGGGAFPADLDLDISLGFISAAIDFSGTTIPVTDPGLPAAIFGASAVSPDAIPNPAGLPGLKPPDVRRITLGGMIDLMGLLLNETVETQRGDHQHVLACGTIDVTVDQVHNVPIIRNRWTNCPAHGLYLSGDFTLDWADPGQLSGGQPLTARIRGSLQISGGVPTVTLTELDWTIAGYPGTVTISGRLANTGQALTYGFVLPIDD